MAWSLMRFTRVGPGCVVTVEDTAGHMGSDPMQEITENLNWLRDGVPPPESR